MPCEGQSENWCPLHVHTCTCIHVHAHIHARVRAQRQTSRQAQGTHHLEVEVSLKARPPSDLGTHIVCALLASGPSQEEREIGNAMILGHSSLKHLTCTGPSREVVLESGGVDRDPLRHQVYCLCWREGSAVRGCSSPGGVPKLPACSSSCLQRQCFLTAQIRGLSSLF